MVIAAILAAAAVAALPADLAKAAHDYDQAQVRSDRVELERLLAPDYRLQNSGGAVQGLSSNGRFTGVTLGSREEGDRSR